jgi:ribosomal protein S2
MAQTEFVPLIERKVIIDHTRPMIDVQIDDLRQLEARYENIGQKLEQLRIGPARYSSLQRPVQALMLDMGQTLTVIRRALEALADTVQDHQHEFSVSLRSQPRNH